VTLFVVKIPAQYLPFAIIFLKFIIGSPQAAMIEATGLVAAYVYDLMTGLYPDSGIKRNLITTPRWMNKMLGTQRVVERPYGSIVVPGGGESAWGLDLSWKRFGPGHTLGGEGSRTGRQRPKGLALAAMVMGAFIFLCLLLGYLFLQPDTWPVLGLPWFGAATDTPKSGV
jgi:Derlin-2/3